MKIAERRAGVGHQHMMRNRQKDELIASSSPLVSFSAIFLSLVFVTTGYVASFGPAHSLAMRGYLSPRLILVFYYPLPKGVARYSLHWWRTHVDGYGDGIMFHR